PHLVALGLGEAVAVGAAVRQDRPLIRVQVTVDVDARRAAVVGLVPGTNRGTRWPPRVNPDRIPVAVGGAALALPRLEPVRRVGLGDRLHLSVPASRPVLEHDGDLAAVAVDLLAARCGERCGGVLVEDEPPVEAACGHGPLLRVPGVTDGTGVAVVVDDPAGVVEVTRRGWLGACHTGAGVDRGADVVGPLVGDAPRAEELDEA